MFTPAAKRDADRYVRIIKHALFVQLVVIIDYEYVRVKVSFFLFLSTPHAYQY